MGTHQISWEKKKKNRKNGTLIFILENKTPTKMSILFLKMPP
jgi:hypothetical protein